ncbi:carbohydrate binding domain-containing protein [Alkalibacterium sp. f15]|uniref:carbohydrate binding domain-containing protein n=1 Tax=Alkalibacterium sp. f15 TaxID=3414029 RepID=UPI003BF8911E
MFFSRGDNETISRTEIEAKSGNHSLLVKDREEALNGPYIRVEEQIDLTKEYLYSIWVKLVDKTVDDLQLSTQIGEGDSASYQIIDTQSISSNEWVHLEGTFRYDSKGDDFISVYVKV